MDPSRPRAHGTPQPPGGITIYILEGRGYTEINDQRIDWKAGDLVILPITPGGFPHQHFCLDDQLARWIGFVHRPLQEAMGAVVEQVVDAHDSFGPAGT